MQFSLCYYSAPVIYYSRGCFCLVKILSKAARVQASSGACLGFRQRCAKQLPRCALASPKKRLVIVYRVIRRIFRIDFGRQDARSLRDRARAESLPEEAALREPCSLEHLLFTPLISGTTANAMQKSRVAESSLIRSKNSISPARERALISRVLPLFRARFARLASCAFFHSSRPLELR